jgi:hypothetical protein
MTYAIGISFPFDYSKKDRQEYNNSIGRYGGNNLEKPGIRMPINLGIKYQF